MITAETLSQHLTEFLGTETSAQLNDGRIAVLTPAEYPNLDGVVVWVEQLEQGSYVVSDHGEADSSLVPRVSARAIAVPAAGIARRFDVSFDGGQVTATADDASLAETCWRVAQAAAAIAEGATFHRVQQPRDPEFVELMASELRRRNVDLEREAVLEGASGHPHKASLYLPTTGTVLEPVSGEHAWQIASAVYVEFGDLRSANGYKLFAVLDDRDSAVGEDVATLLRQVANVSRWSRHSEWMSALVGGGIF
jgi:hypothetical protein